MRILPKISGPCIVVPSEPVLKSLNDCNGDFLKVLLYILSNTEFDESVICDQLDITKKTFKNSLKYWSERGVIVVDDSNNLNQVTTRVVAPSNDIKSYTKDEIADFCENNPHFQELKFNCEQIRGKFFNLAETEVLIRLVDYLKLDDEYIMLLFSHCKKMDKLSVRYLEKLAISLFDDGILEYEELDSYLTTREEYHKIEHILRNTFGIKSRKLTKIESDAFNRWTMEYKFPLEIIELAYDITVQNTGSASIPYCDTVLKNWNNSGYTTIEEIQNAIEKYKHDKLGEKDKSGSFETDDFFEAALKRSYEN